MVFNGRPLVGWNRRAIERGAFLYGFSHIPYHSLVLPQRTFTFTFLRDPSERVVSHFRMLKDMLAEDSNHPAVHTEGAWARGNFSEFLDNLPRQHLQNQLFMFDQEFDVDRALASLATVDCVYRVEETDRFLANLACEFGITLSYRHLRKSRHEMNLSEDDRDKMMDMLKLECKFYHRAKLTATAPPVSTAQASLDTSPSLAEKTER